jgi:hypothetical protein
MPTSLFRPARNFLAATALAVLATSAVAYASGAPTAPSGAVPTTVRDPHVHDGPQVPAPPRFIPIAGPNGKTVVDADGKPLMMDTQPGTGDPNPNGQTVVATGPEAAAATSSGNANETPAASIVRPYDDSKYHER